MSSCSRSRYQLSGSNRSSAARVQGVQGRLQRGLEGMIRWLRPMTAANSSSDQARFTRPGEQHQQPGQGRRAISVPLTAVKSGAGRPRPGTQVGSSGHDGLFRSDSQADSASFEPDPHRVGHSWDTAQPSIEPTSITAGHRPSTSQSLAICKTVPALFPLHQGAVLERLVARWRGVLAEDHRPCLQLRVAQESTHKARRSADTGPVVVP